MSDVVAAVLTRPIDLAALPADTSWRVRELVARCLERDPKKRLRDIGEARVALESPSEASVTTSPAGATVAASSSGARIPASSPTSNLPWAMVAVAGIAAGALAVYALTGARAPATTASGPRTILELGAPAGSELLVASNAGSAVISPDGTTVAFLVQSTEGRRLTTQSLTSGETRVIPTAPSVNNPFWSPSEVYRRRGAERQRPAVQSDAQLEIAPVTGRADARPRGPCAAGIT